MKRLVIFLKDFLLYFPVTLIVSPFSKLFLFLAYFNKLVIFIRKNKHALLFSDYYSPQRDYTKRYTLYQILVDNKCKASTKILYLEFGVAEGASFNWWLANNQHADSLFFGFDTFEGLPEKWGSFYEKGDMRFSVPSIEDERGKFFKGLFQDTLPAFISENNTVLKQPTKKIILLDADLYSATIFTLSQLFSTLHKGDIIMFDEFSVAMHEFKAFDEFVNNFYIKLVPIAAVNNFYQIAFEVA